MKNNNKAFTLIEIIVSVAIFSIMMISIISIFIVSSDTSLKTDINRALHENTKSVAFEIAEDIRKSWISGVAETAIDICNFDSTWFFKSGSKLCTNSWNTYYLAKEVAGIFTRVESDSCDEVWDHCIIVKNGEPLTNSLVSIKELNFYISWEWVNKATINIVLQPNVKSWVKPALIKENRLIFQTTVSERPF